MSGIEEKSVAVDPCRIIRIEIQKFGKQDM